MDVLKDDKLLHQGQPEYAHSNYLKLCEMENEGPSQRCNYFDPFQNQKLWSYLFQNFKNGKKTKDAYTVNKNHRKSAIQLIIKLCQVRKYNLYTLYLSTNIFDRYLACVGHWTLVENEIDYLICISCFVAAKVEQQKKPLLDNLILEYRSLTRKILRRDLLLIMERQVLVELGLDFNYSNPEHFIDRYLRLLGYHVNKQVNKNAI